LFVCFFHANGPDRTAFNIFYLFFKKKIPSRIPPSPPSHALSLLAHASRHDPSLSASALVALYMRMLEAGGAAPARAGSPATAPTDADARCHVAVRGIVGLLDTDGLVDGEAPAFE
jgi:hypothetical protein